MYNHKFIRINNERLHIIASNISKCLSILKRDWTKDQVYWLNHWEIVEEDTLQDNNIVKITIITMSKEIINPRLDDQN
jgi:hypothetical protein